MLCKDETYENEAFALDGKEFENCIFKGCKLTYAGGPLQLKDTQFIDSAIEFTGAARAGVDVFKYLQSNVAKSSSIGSTMHLGGSVFTKTS